MTPTPLEPAPASLAGKRTLFLKREDVHELGAFKWRGALPVLTGYREAGARTVVTASTGNHGAATAWAAERLGLEAIVYAPESAAEAKLTLIRELGAEIRLVGTDMDEAKDEARRHAESAGLPLFEDGAEPAQYEGYGAIADEIVDQLEERPAAVVAPVGNGALFGGIGLQLAARTPETLRVGVAAREAPVMVESWRTGTVATSDRSATFADGLAVRVAIPLAVDVLDDVASRMLLVSERELARAVGAYAAEEIRVEGAGAATLAALPQLADVDGAVVLIVTGRNIDDDLYTRAVTHPDSFPD
ncbi:MAG TPA: pyridoxal-phosphate dependent enzyme [Gaiellaceae bacterium]|nr:pyridoxal-phosphate dependent enzyme [Gaiellaceae bacterium]